MPHADLPLLHNLAQLGDLEVIKSPLPRGVILYNEDAFLSPETSSAARITDAGAQRLFEHIISPLIEFPGHEIAVVREALPEPLDEAPDDVALRPETPLERLLVEFREFMTDHYDRRYHKELWQVIDEAARFGRLAVLQALAMAKQPNLPQAS